MSKQAKRKHSFGSLQETKIAEHLVLNRSLIPRFLKEKRYAELLALSRYVDRDVPTELADVDPSLYRRLRDGVTELLIGGFGFLDSAKLAALAGE